MKRRVMGGLDQGQEMNMEHGTSTHDVDTLPTCLGFKGKETTDKRRSPAGKPETE